MTQKLNSDKTTLVTQEQLWQEINKEAPKGIKCLLINKTAGVAYIGVLTHGDSYPTHYAAFPKFKKEIAL